MLLILRKEGNLNAFTGFLQFFFKDTLNRLLQSEGGNICFAKMRLYHKEDFQNIWRIFWKVGHFLKSQLKVWSGTIFRTFCIMSVSSH